MWHKLIKKIKDAQILFISINIVIILFLIGSLENYFNSKSIFEKYVSKTYMIDSLETDALKYIDDGYYQATDNDPKIIIKNPGEVCSIKFYMEYYTYPGEIMVYFKTDSNQEYNEKNRVWANPIEGSPHWFKAKIDCKNISELRIDPTIYRGNKLKFGVFVLNEYEPLNSFLTITPDIVLKFIIYSGVISSIIKLVFEILIKNNE